MLGLSDYEAGICDCGFHESLTHDKANVFSFKTDRCPVCTGRARYERLQASDDREEEEKLGENPPPTAQRPSDGRRVFMQMARPGLVAEQAPGE